MELVYFALAGITLYFLADRIVAGLERLRGRVFENRTVVFFLVILPLALVTFEILQRLLRS